MSQFDQLLFWVGFPKHTLVACDILLMPGIEVIADTGETETDITNKTDIAVITNIEFFFNNFVSFRLISDLI
jgi:hypothetical protein